MGDVGELELELVNGGTEVVEGIVAGVDVVGIEDGVMVMVQVNPIRDCSVVADPISSETRAGQLQSYFTTNVDEIVEL